MVNCCFSGRAKSTSLAIELLVEPSPGLEGANDMDRVIRPMMPDAGSLSGALPGTVDVGRVCTATASDAGLSWVIIVPCVVSAVPVSFGLRCVAAAWL